MKRIKWLVAASFLAAAAAAVLTACGEEENPPIDVDGEEPAEASSQTFEAPANLAWDAETWTLTWDETAGAVSYVVKSDELGETYQTNETEYAFEHIFVTESSYCLAVYAVDESGAISDWSEELVIETETPTAALTYTLLEDKSGYEVKRKYSDPNQGLEGRVVIADYYNGLPVKSIAEEAFELTAIGLYYDIETGKNCNTVTTGVHLPKYLESVGDSAFEYCIALETIVFPGGLEEIGASAFSNCISLGGVAVPQSVVSLEEGAFRGCQNLLEVSVEAALQTFEALVFDGTAWLENQTDDYIILRDDILYSYQGDETVLNGFPSQIKYVAGGAFYGNTDLVSVDLTGVEFLGQKLFYKCTSLAEVSLPEVKTILGFTFCECSALESITIPDGVTSIGEYAFSNCASLTSVTIGSGMTSIGYMAFNRCTSLTAVYYNGTASQWASLSFDGLGGAYSNPLRYAGNLYLNGTLAMEITLEGITSISAYSFRGCTSLESITIGNGVTSIGSSAFRDCTSLESITIGNGVTSIGSSTFQSCVSLVNVTIPDSVTSIGSSAFRDCTSLESITIGNGVTSIGGSAFRDCTSLTAVYYNGTASRWAGISFDGSGDVYSNPLCYAGNLYLNGTLATEITLEGISSISAYSFYGCTSLTNVTIGNSVTSVGSYAFRDCASLTSVTIGNGVTSIGEYAFGECTAQIVWDQPSITEIGSYAFANYGGTEFLIPSSVTSIGDSAFRDCPSLVNVTIPDSVTSTGDSAFRDCTSLTAVYYNGTASQWASISFGGVSANPLYYAGNLYLDETLAADITLEGITSINAYSFCGYSLLANVTIGDSVTSIGNSAFRDCTSLKSVTIGNNVTEILAGAFKGCGSLAEIVIPDSMTSIGNSAFCDCTSLKSVTIGNNVTEILAGAFKGCGSLAEIVIPDSVTSIANSVFADCSSLVSIIIPDGVTSIELSLFSGCSSLAEIVIPASVTSIRLSAFRNCSQLQSVFYRGTEEKWNEITIGNYNSELLSAGRYYYSSNEPALAEDGASYDGNYWYYNASGEIVIWSKAAEE